MPSLFVVIALFPVSFVDNKGCCTHIWNRAAFHAEFVAQRLNDSVQKNSTSSRALFGTAIMSQAVNRYYSPLNVIGFAVAFCCFLFKQNCYPNDKSYINTADRTMLKRHSERSEITDVCPFSSIKSILCLESGSSW